MTTATSTRQLALIITRTKGAAATERAINDWLAARDAPLRSAAAAVLANYQLFLDTDDLEGLRLALTLQQEALA